jgi:glycosyltransferase involved in cell wall biosynthesis
LKNNRILFYSSVSSLNLFEVTGFYKYDIEALESMGYIVIKTNSLKSFFKFWMYDISFLYFYKKSIFPAITSFLLNKKIFYTGGIDELSNDFKIKPIKRVLHKILFIANYSLSHRCNIVSKNDLENTTKLLSSISIKNARKLIYFPHCIDVENSLFSAISEKDYIFTSICWMGSIENVKRKGLDVSLKIFKLFLSLYPNFKFYIIGTPGAGKIYLENLIKELDLHNNVFFTGQLNENQKIELLNKSMFYFQVSQYEGFGLAVLEAMICRNYIIHSGKGGLKDTIGENGLIVKQNNYFTNTIKALNQVYKNYSSEIKNLDRNREYVKDKFNIKERATNFVKIIK